MEVSGPIPVPIYEPSLPPEIEHHRPGGGGKIAKLWLLWRERRLFWGVAWKTLLLATVVSFLLPRHYEAVVKIVPGESTTTGMMGLLGKLAGGGSSSSSGGMGLGLDAASLLGVKTPGAFYVQVLRSRSLQDRMIDRFNLRTRYWKTGQWWPKNYYETRKKLKSFTDIEEDKKSNVITITVTDYDPFTAARIANAYVQELNRAAADLNTGDAHRERVFLESRLQGAKQDLDRASLTLSQYSSKNTIMDPQNQGKAVLDAAARVEGEIVGAEAELKALQQIYSDDNVRVRSLKARLGVLRGQLRSMTGKDPGGTPNAGGADAPVDYPSMSALSMLGYRYSDLYRQTKIQEVVYEFLTQQYELAKIQEAKELPTVRVMDPAAPPERKSAPIRSLIVSLSVLGALMLTAVWVITRHNWQQIPRDDPRRMLTAEVASEFRRVTSKFRRRGR